MPHDDRTRWNRQHAAKPAAREPAGFLRQVVESGSWDLAPGKALDLACGQGRNALYLATRGFGRHCR
jgi:hypothetical protein